jgi:hypothetical protein
MIVTPMTARSSMLVAPPVTVATLTKLVRSSFGELSSPKPMSVDDPA